MLFLDDTRIKFDKKSEHFKEHYLLLEDKSWYCPKCDKIHLGSSNELIYLGECDVVFHIHNLPKPKLYPAHQMINKTECRVNCCLSAPEIPNLIKLIENIFIKSDNQTDKIKARDNFKCQKCGFDDDRALEVHHIVHKLNPFVHESFKRDPINCITLCANCHRITHHNFFFGATDIRKESFLELGEINGWLLKWVNPQWFESNKIMREYSKFK